MQLALSLTPNCSFSVVERGRGCAKSETTVVVVAAVDANIERRPMKYAHPHRHTSALFANISPV